MLDSRRTWGTVLGACVALILLLAPRSVSAQEPTSVLIQDKVESIGERLLRTLAMRGEPVRVLGWPPTFHVKEMPRCGPACAGYEGIQPVVVIPPSTFSELFADNQDFLALAVGHEIGHHVLGHTGFKEHDPSDTSLVVRPLLNQADELAADSFGMALAGEAGYSDRRAIWGFLAWHGFYARRGLDPSPVRALRSTHPSWAERATLANLFLDDEEQARLWTSIGTFQDGVTFLSLQQYEAAASAFEAVVRDHPDVPEAWANLGYANLMRYCDVLEPVDIEAFGFDLTQLSAGGFYIRSGSMESRVRDRAIRADLWRASVEALEEALELKPEMTLARGHLGLAYLVGPDGRRDISLAATLLRAAHQEAWKDPLVKKRARVAIVLNLAAAELALGDEQKFRSHIQEAARTDDAGASLAVRYGRALLLARSNSDTDRVEASRLLRAYLRDASRASLWWKMAYLRYQDLVESLGGSAEPAPPIPSRGSLRLVTSVDVPPDVTIRLAEPIRDVTSKLGGSQTERIARGVGLVRYRWDEYDLEAVSVRGRVLLIRCYGSNAPAIAVRPAGLGTSQSETTRRVHVGMTASELERVLGTTFHLSLQDPAIDAGAFHRYYPEVGLAIRVFGGRVAEVVVARIVLSAREAMETRAELESE